MSDQDESTPTEHAPGTNGAAPDTIEVSHLAPQPVAQVWRRLTTREGIEALLGQGAMLGGKGEPWHSADGTHGVTRSYHPEQQVRVSWHADSYAPATLVDLQLAPEGAGTRLSLRHEHLRDDMPQDALRQRWSEALTRLASS